MVENEANKGSPRYVCDRDKLAWVEAPGKSSEAESIKEEPVQYAEKPLVQMEPLRPEELKSLKKAEVRRGEAAESKMEKLLKFEEPGDLKAAVIYREILGKPVGLRNYQPPN